LKEPRKNREVEHQIEVSKPKPNQNQDTTYNVKEVGEDKNFTGHYHLFLVDWEEKPLR